MDGLDLKPDFGIEDTIDIGGIGNQNLLNDLVDDGSSASASPDDITSVEDDKDDSAADKKQPVDKTTDGEKIPEKTAKNPQALTDFLLGEEEEEEEEQDDDDDDNNNNEDDNDEPKDGLQTSKIKEENEEPGEGNIAFDALANDLFELGVFTKNEDEEEINISSPEEFLERFNLEKEKGAQAMISNFIGQFGQEYQEAFQAIYVNGVNPKDYFSTAIQVEDFANMDLTVESNQEAVIRQTLQDQGFETEDINSEIEKLRNYGDLEDTSKRYHKVLVKKEAQALKQKQQEAAQLQQMKAAQKQQYVENVRDVLTEKLKAKEFDGIPLNVQTANELQDFLLVDKWKTASGETLSDFDKAILDLKRPENHATKVKVALLLKLLEKDPTLSTIQKSAVSKKSSTLFKEVARQKTTAKRTSDNKRPTASSWFK